MEVAPTPTFATVLHMEWLTWSNLPWMQRGGSLGAEVQFCFRLLESAAQTEGQSTFLKQELPEVASQFAAQWVGVLRRGSEWERLAEFGRQPVESLPQPFLTEVLERDSAGFSIVATHGNGGGWNFCAAPLHKGGVRANCSFCAGTVWRRNRCQEFSPQPGLWAGDRKLPGGSTCKRSGSTV